VKRFEEHGTVFNLNSKTENRPTHAGTPKKLLRKTSQELRIKMGSPTTILEKYLGLNENFNDVCFSEAHFCLSGQIVS